MTPDSRGDQEQGAVGDWNAVRGAVSPQLRIHVHLVAVVLVGAFTTLAGFAGALGGLAIVAVWYGFGAPYAVGFGHVALVTLFPTEIDPLSFIVLEGAFVLIVLASPPRTATHKLLQYSLATLAAIGVLGGIGWFVLRGATQPIWIAGIALLASTGCLLYGLHRYERVFVLERPEQEQIDPESGSTGLEHGGSTTPTSTPVPMRQQSETATHDHERT